MESRGLVGDECLGRNRRRTRWECCLVIACAGVVVAFEVLQSMASTTCGPHRENAPRDIASISAAIDSFMSAHDGHAPESLEVLVTPDAIGDTYLKDRTVVPIDPWNDPYGYEPPTGERGYRVFSFGRDGQPGGTGDDADIDNFTIAAEGKR